MLRPCWSASRPRCSCWAAIGSSPRSRADGLSPFELAEIRTYDWRLTHTARPESARKDIAIVEIDEPSLRSLQPNAGRWPWPRAVHSMLLDYLARAPAKVIAYDVVFSEADTRLGFDFGGSTMSGAESDRMLADSVKAAGNVILLADASYDAEVENLALPDTDYPLDVPGVYELRGVLPPIKVLADAASGLGHNRFVLDPDGPLRHSDSVRAHAPSRGAVARCQRRPSRRRHQPAGRAARRDDTFGSAIA